MRIFHDSDAIDAECRGAVLALGNFDGVHRGHQAVIGEAARLAEADGRPYGVITFEPHPVRYFAPDAEPFCLTPFRNKAHHLEALGVEILVCLTFDAALAALEAETFIDRILVERLGVGRLVVGYDFRFGKGRRGDVAMLQADGRFAVSVVEPAATADGVVYSSTRLREHLREGKPAHAAALLGRPFEIEAPVVAGRQLGRTIGFPTANLELGDYVRPAYGVYAVRAGIEDEGADDHGAPFVWHDGVANWGRRPTVEGVGEVFEVYLFEVERDLYGRHLRVALIEFLRPEARFDGLDALKAAIAEDCRRARLILNARAAGA